MKIHLRSWLLAITTVLILFAAMLQGAQASPLKEGTLPSYKEPPSARFTISGTINTTVGATSQNSSIELQGSGAMVGKQLQEDLTITVPGSGAGGTSPISITSSQILSGSLVY